MELLLLELAQQLTAVSLSRYIRNRLPILQSDSKGCSQWEESGCLVEAVEQIWMLSLREAKDVLAGKVIVDKDGNPLSGTMQTMSGGTYTPSTSQQRISCAEKKMTGDIIIPAFTLPSANVIKKV